MLKIPIPPDASGDIAVNFQEEIDDSFKE